MITFACQNLMVVGSYCRPGKIITICGPQGECALTFSHCNVRTRTIEDNESLLASIRGHTAIEDFCQRLSPFSMCDYFQVVARNCYLRI